VRGRQTGPARAAADEPALAGRGGRHRGVEGRAVG
jgi:hypothetical protein